MEGKRKAYNTTQEEAWVEMMEEAFENLCRPCRICPNDAAIEGAMCPICYNGILEDLIAAGLMPPDTCRWDPRL
jgi:hypothetical protein